ncbi:MAG: mechanosensitive ion channel protein MscS [Phycisphaerae bacterium]|nr:mechanosensitive ion channel protein MscS [Phycisphaerae bacterium]
MLHMLKFLAFQTASSTNATSSMSQANATVQADPSRNNIVELADLSNSTAATAVRAWHDALHDLVGITGWNESVVEWVSYVIFALAVLLVCFVSNWLAKFMIHRLVDRALERRGGTWGKLLVQEKVLTRLSHLIPVFILAIALPLLFPSGIREWIFPILDVYTIWIFLMVAYALVDVVGHWYTSREHTRDTAIEGILQATKLVFTLVAILCVLSVVFAKSPLWFLSGIGAFMAILLLVFRDSLLGLVAGLQLAANDMVRVGDWIEIPGTRVDGEVVEVSLTTVQVQNWDRTISLVPAYDLFQKAFVNWRGMSDSGGRRIKRSINIDVNSITYADVQMLQEFQSFTILKPYLDEKIQELSVWNEENNVDDCCLINGRRQTNIGIFRAYVKAYLRAHPKIHQDGFTFLVRQLPPTEAGLPLEIYVFTNDNNWVPYEEIQADIFDHLLAAIPGFGLRVFQSPTGADVRECGNAAGGAV